MKLEFHHINFVTEDVERLTDFYTRVLGLATVPQEDFARTRVEGDQGYGGQIGFATDGHMQMHLAERDLACAFRNGGVINPLERGHIAFRTDDIEALIATLKANNIPYSDYGTAFSAELHQVFFQDPEGNIVEVHQPVA